MPIATAIIMIAPLTFCAPLSALIIALIMILSRPTAVMPFAKPPRSIIPSKIVTPAKIAIETDMASKVPANFPLCPPILATINISAMSSTNSSITTRPLAISPGSIPEISFMTPTIRTMAIEILRTVPPNFETLPPAIILATPIWIINSTKTSITARPLIISSGSIPAISFIAPVMSNMAIDIFNTVPPNLLTAPPANILAAAI